MAVDNTANAVIDPARASLAGTIKQAAAATGANFGYLVATAKIESNLNPSAAAPASSARGLYQFIEQTWLGTVKEAGAAFGYDRYANAITRNASGRYQVADPAMRREILQLRSDPAANAAMAGVLTRSNGFKLTGALGRRPTEGELYIAHFLGAGGASRLISSTQTHPQAIAANMFPRAAAANRAIFYDRSGNARSVSQVYSDLTGRYAVAANSVAARSLMSAAGGTPATGASSMMQASLLAGAGPAVTLSPPQAAAMQRVALSPEQADADGRRRGIEERNSRFHSLFQTDRAEPVSAAVRELWSNGSTSSSSGIASDIQKAQPAAAPNTATDAPRDLFSDRFGQFAS